MTRPTDSKSACPPYFQRGITAQRSFIFLLYILYPPVWTSEEGFRGSAYVLLMLLCLLGGQGASAGCLALLLRIHQRDWEECKEFLCNFSMVQKLVPVGTTHSFVFLSDNVGS